MIKGFLLFSVYDKIVIRGPPCGTHDTMTDSKKYFGDCVFLGWQACAAFGLTNMTIYPWASHCPGPLYSLYH